MKLLYALLKRRYRASARLYERPPAQAALLAGILSANRNSAYGKEYGFSEIRTEADYRNRVPVVTYDTLAPRVQRILRGEAGVLTEEPVTLLEPTGGSSGTQKWVPYTKTLQRQFQKSVEAWLHDIYTSYPGVGGGKAYWMITPPFSEEEQKDAKVPVGFDDDAAYLGSAGRALMNRIMVQPDIAPGMDTEAFYTATLLALAAEENLRLLSVWNPSLLLHLLAYLKDQAAGLGRKLSPRRAASLKEAAQAENWQNLWPHLSFLSCWADGSAVADAEKLAARLPFVTLQPKGLLSTECIVSFPTRESLAHGGMLPAYHSTYLEFRSGDRVVGLEETEDGGEYDVIATTGGGLYRYDTADRVKVTGRLRGLSLFRFTGRANTVDLVGEKLTPGFVETVFSDLAGFYLLAAADRGYVLYTDTAISAREAESRLCRGHHYALARKLGQLSAVRVFRITGDAERQYFDACRARGQRLGDIKPVHLSPGNDFTFTGAYHD